MKNSQDWGAWMFRNRSWLPVPLAFSVIVISRHLHLTPRLVASGLALEGMGEGLRMWALRHIGAISRTRAGRLGPLVTSGPYAFVRNPLYIGNWCLWTGVVVCAGVVWMLPVVWLLFGVQYTLMAAHEEHLLLAHHADYACYRRAVPGWIPRLLRAHPAATSAQVRWGSVLVSERSTLLAIALMAGLILWR
jgi:protein-S-isoprenylcysteine O-methyltransferase Ste14